MPMTYIPEYLGGYTKIGQAKKNATIEEKDQ